MATVHTYLYRSPLLDLDLGQRLMSVAVFWWCWAFDLYSTTVKHRGFLTSFAPALSLLVRAPTLALVRAPSPRVALAHLSHVLLVFSRVSVLVSRQLLSGQDTSETEVRDWGGFMKLIIEMGLAIFNFHVWSLILMKYSLDMEQIPTDYHWSIFFFLHSVQEWQCSLW